MSDLRSRRGVGRGPVRRRRGGGQSAAWAGAGDGAARAAVEALEGRRLLTTIDVMVLYSNNALAGFGNSEPAIQRAIRQSLDIANLAHQNTADGVVLRLVHTGLLNYTSTASQNTQLSALKANATAAILRNTYGADLVSMIVDSPSGGGGLGDLLANPAGSAGQAFSVVGYHGVGPGSLVLAHEMGHNMGAGHEQDNATEYSEGAFPAYSFGYHTNYAGPSAHGNDYGDVMSYQGAELPVFSYAGFVHDGAPLGTGTADLHTTFLATAPNVANYRSTVVANAGPTATLYRTDLVGDQLTFDVRYADDLAVDATTFDDSDAYVTTPEGFQLRAQFVGADVAGNGYARTARYRVTLPKNLPAVPSLGFHLTAGLVTDANGVAAAGGQLAPDVDGDLERGLAGPQLARALGEFGAGTTRRATGRVGDVNDFQDMHAFTVTQNMTVGVTVSGIGGGLTSDPVLFLYRV